MSNAAQPLDAALDLAATSPDYSTSPQERLAAHLARDLRRHFQQRDDVDFTALGDALAAELADTAAGYTLDHFTER